MQKGFNSDIQYRGLSYHVQTEDWGQQNPYIVSRIFRNGAVILTQKKSYAEIFGPTASEKKSELIIKQVLRQQHSDIVDKLISGQLNLSIL